MNAHWVGMAIRGREAEVAAKSLVNCHAIGLDSILFDDTPGSRIRLFITRPEHTLWTNHGFETDMSLAVHPHHCDVTLHCVRGMIQNLAYRVLGSSHLKVEGAFVDKWRYESAITGKEATFTKVGTEHLKLTNATPMYSGHEKSMHADILHTVAVPMGVRAAWFVYEGMEDECYQPYCYSRADLSKFDASELYKPMSVENMMKVLNGVMLL